MTNAANKVALSGDEALAVLTGYWLAAERIADEQIALVEPLGRGIFALPDGIWSKDGMHSAAAQWQGLLDNIRQGFCIIEVLFDEDNHPTDYRFLQVNHTFEAETGLQNAVGRTMRAFKPDHEEHWFRIYGDVALTGVSARFEGPAAALSRWYDVHAFRVGVPDQHKVAVLFSDITERKRQEELVAILANDGDHRAKNMLSLVTGLVRLTHAETVPEFQRKLLGGINALANSQQFLSRNPGRKVELGQLIESGLATYETIGAKRSTVTGPAVELAPKVAQCLAIALHELGTNAAKYGAFSNGEGRVLVECRCADDGHLSVRWSETGGPPVTVPTSYGVGSSVISRCIEGQLGGSVNFDWRAEGLVCNLVLKVAGHRASESH